MSFCKTRSHVFINWQQNKHSPLPYITFFFFFLSLYFFQTDTRNDKKKKRNAVRPWRMTLHNRFRWVLLFSAVSISVYLTVTWKFARWLFYFYFIPRQQYAFTIIIDTYRSLCGNFFFFNTRIDFLFFFRE